VKIDGKITDVRNVLNSTSQD